MFGEDKSIWIKIYFYTITGNVEILSYIIIPTYRNVY
jgi:hypothetical protein